MFNSKKCQSCINLFISIIIFFLICMYIRYNVNFQDDFFRSFFLNIVENYSDILNSADQGRYLSSIYQGLTCSSIPILIGTHPNDSILPIVIKSFNTVVICFFIAKLSLLDKKNEKSINLFIYLFSVFSIFLIISNNIVDIVNNTMHFVYLFNFLFGVVAIYTISKYYINGTAPEEKDIFKNSLIAVCTGFSGCLINVSVFFFTIFLAFLSLIRKETEIKFLFGKKIILPYILFLLSCLFSFINTDFKFFFQRRVYSENLQPDILIGNIREYFLPYFQNIFYNHYHFLFLVILIVFLITVYIIGKRQNDIQTANKHILISLGIMFGIFVFDFLLVFLGKNTYYAPDVFWIDHHEIQTVTSLFYLSSIMICLNYLKKYKITNILILLSSFIVLSLFVMNRNNIIEEYNYSKERRIKLYQCEDAFVYQLKNNYKTIILPDIFEMEDWKHKQLIFPVSIIYNFEDENIPDFDNEIIPYEDFIVKMKEYGLDYSNLNADNVKFSDIMKKY